MSVPCRVWLMLISSRDETDRLIATECKMAELREYRILFIYYTFLAGETVLKIERAILSAYGQLRMLLSKSILLEVYSYPL